VREGEGEGEGEGGAETMRLTSWIIIIASAAGTVAGYYFIDQNPLTVGFMAVIASFCIYTNERRQ
jgi:hypothetical protein